MSIRRRTAEALGNIGDVRAKKPLREATHDRDLAASKSCCDGSKTLFVLIL